jgi:hypothetical protein
MILCSKDGAEKLVNPIQLFVFAFSNDQNAACTKYHKRHLRTLQLVFTLYPRVATRVVTTFDMIFLFQKGIQFFAVDVIVTSEVRVDENDLLFFSKFEDRRLVIGLQKPGNFLDNSRDMFFFLDARDFDLSCVEQLDMDFLKLILDLEPINENKTVIKCTFFILFHFQDVLLTHANVDLSHILKHDSPRRVVDLIQDGRRLVSIYLLEVFFKRFDLLLFGEIELDLLLDNTLLVIVIGNHRQIPKEYK